MAPRGVRASGVLLTLLLMCLRNPRAMALNLRSARAQGFLEGMHEDGVFGHIVDAVSGNDMKDLLKEANDGNPAAMTTLGTMYAEGIDVEQDEAAAVEWYRKAAELGYVGGQYNLAGMLLAGKGSKEDIDGATYWFKQAAQQMCDPEGHARACMPTELKLNGEELQIVREGPGADSPVKRLALKSGGAPAWDSSSNSDDELERILDESLPVLYHADGGIKGDSLTLVSVSAYQSPIDLDSIIEDGSDKIRPTIDYEEHSAYLSDASGTANGGMEVSEGIASILMSSLLMRGAADADSLVKHLGEEEAFQEAVAVCKEKAEGGDARYALIYAVLLQEGHGVAQDLEGAFKFFKIAADKGSKEGINNVGTCLEKGVGVAQDIMAAHKWYVKADKAGDASGKLNLGSMYERGVAVKKRDLRRAFILYKEAADAGHAGAMNNIGVLYAAGKGVDRDVIQAKRWLRKAIEVPSAIYHYTEAFEENTDNDEYEEDEDEEGGDDLDPFVTPGRDPCREALYNLGVMQLISGGGGGVGIHLKREAAKWFALAAEKGVMDSGYEMGRMV